MQRPGVSFGHCSRGRDSNVFRFPRRGTVRLLCCNIPSEEATGSNDISISGEAGGGKPALERGANAAQPVLELRTPRGRRIETGRGASDLNNFTLRGGS